MGAEAPIYIFKLKFRTKYNILIISHFKKMEIVYTFTISNLKNIIKIVFVRNNFCGIRCKISKLKFFHTKKCQN